MRVIDVIEEPDVFSVVMPYYRLGCLQDYCPADKPKVYETVFLQILLVLSWLHSRGVVHRDIKPENILIENEAPLKIIVADFGLSKVSANPVLTTFCGTPDYCAPEVFPGNSEEGYGPKADMWSLGVMMLKLMFGLPNGCPLPSLNNHPELRKWVADWSKELDRELHNFTDDNTLMAVILMDLIEVDPEKRFTADECLHRGLELGLFRRNRRGQIVLQNATDVNTSASGSQKLDSRGSLDECKTSTMQLPQSKERETTDISKSNRERSRDRFEHQRCVDDQVAPANISPADSHHNSGPPRRRQKTGDTSNRLHSVQDLDFDKKRYALRSYSLAQGGRKR